MFNLHYAHINLRRDIPVYKFEKHHKMIDFIDQKCYGRHGEVVWLLAREDDTDIIISESHVSIQMTLEKKFNWQSVGNYFLQEYNSFEEAYNVALEMVETSHLCYEPK